MPASGSVFNHAVHTANAWLADVGTAFGNDDRRYAYRMVRAWLHTLRDRLTVGGVAKFGAQLPELLRGAYYEGWDPSNAPIKYGPHEYAVRFAYEARIAIGDVPHAAATVTAALGHRLSPGQLEEVLAQLPGPLRSMLGAAGDRESARPAEPGEDEAPGATEDLVAELRVRVDRLTDAVRILAKGFEETPGSGVDEAGRAGPATPTAGSATPTVGSATPTAGSATPTVGTSAA